jgi:hypothetical protein
MLPGGGAGTAAAGAATGDVPRGFNIAGGGAAGYPTGSFVQPSIGAGGAGPMFDAAPNNGFAAAAPFVAVPDTGAGVFYGGGGGFGGYAGMGGLGVGGVGGAGYPAAGPMMQPMSPTRGGGDHGGSHRMTATSPLRATGGLAGILGASAMMAPAAPRATFDYEALEQLKKVNAELQSQIARKDAKIKALEDEASKGKLQQQVQAYLEQLRSQQKLLDAFQSRELKEDKLRAEVCCGILLFRWHGSIC